MEIESQTQQSRMSDFRYCHLVRVTAAGQCFTKKKERAWEFLHQELPSFSQLSEQEIHTYILERSTHGENGAKICLQCFISHLLKSACTQFAFRFGSKHGFTAQDLYPFVLNDVFLTDILQSFNPDRGSLSSWVSIKFRSNKFLESFLRERGLIRRSNWAILNQMNPESLSIILKDRFHLPLIEIERYISILKVFQSNYRKSRLSQQPIEVVLNEMPQHLQLLGIVLPENNILQEMEKLASYLRQHQVYKKEPSTESLESILCLKDMNSDKEYIPIEFSVSNNTIESLLEQEEQEDYVRLLKSYEQLLLRTLDQSLKLVLPQQVPKPRKNNPNKRENYLEALYLYYCKSMPMGAIACKLRLSGQPSVSRLLQLDQLRAAVRREMLNSLCSCVPALLAKAAEHRQIMIVDHSLEELLAVEIDRSIFLEAESTSFTPKEKQKRDLFSTRLCILLEKERLRYLILKLLPVLPSTNGASYYLAYLLFTI